MATVEERLESLEHNMTEVRATLDRHSNKLTELWGLKDAIAEVKMKMQNLDNTVTDMKRHQLKTDKQLLIYAKATLALMAVLVALFIWIGSRDAVTAKEIASIVVSATTQSIK